MALSKVVKKCLHVLLSGTHIILIIFPPCPQFWIAQLGGNWKEDRWEQDDCVRKVWELCPGNSFLECFTLIAAVEDFSHVWGPAPFILPVVMENRFMTEESCFLGKGFFHVQLCAPRYSYSKWYIFWHQANPYPNRTLFRHCQNTVLLWLSHSTISFLIIPWALSNSLWMPSYAFM